MDRRGVRVIFCQFSSSQNEETKHNYFDLQLYNHSKEGDWREIQNLNRLIGLTEWADLIKPLAYNGGRKKIEP
jgi:hypothetical protein